MSVFKCKMCGGDLILTEGNLLAEYEFCGLLQTVPDLDNEKKQVLFNRANRLRFSCEFDKAAGIYESIVAELMPTCHRSSFNSTMGDGGFEQVLTNADSSARKVYREEAKQIVELRKSIVE